VISQTVEVALGARSYDILVGDGLLARAGALVAPLLRRPRTVIVTDSVVARLHLETLTAALAAAGIAAETVLVPPGEESKSFAELERLVERLLELEVERRDCLIAFGGGVVGDLAGFAASILRRGVDFIQIPTTLLAQVDSSVGGKTGINSRHGKNLVGSFHQPRLVIADVTLLDTLPRRERLAGYAEVVKYGAITDAPFFLWLEEHGAGVVEGERAAQIRAVVTSCRHKARIVAADEREEGMRALLNFGHTFGHALEAEAGFSSRLLHGEAVAIGMVMAMELSAMLGLCPGEDAARLRRHLAGLGLPTGPTAVPGVVFDAPALVRHMQQDKKVEGGRLTFILSRGIGQALISRDVAAAQVMALLEQELAA
jgi:3-dehydroquinate synthase